MERRRQARASIVRAMGCTLRVIESKDQRRLMKDCMLNHGVGIGDDGGVAGGALKKMIKTVATQNKDKKDL